MKKNIFNSFITISIIFCYSVPLQGQRYLTGLDSSLFVKDTLRPFLKIFGNLRFSGYIQSQFQAIGANGASSYGGGDFDPDAKTRFMLRRARMKMDYLSLTREGKPKALFTFQVDATERTVRVRDMFVRLYETKKGRFSLTSGIFAKPFGYEVNLSSAFRETPERGRMSQILIPSERDLGIMLSMDPREQRPEKWRLHADLGVFNGPGLSAPTDFDNFKDLAGRLTIVFPQKNRHQLYAGISWMRGGWKQVSPITYQVGVNGSGKLDFIADSSSTNIGKAAPRHYYGADFQWIIDHGWGNTEIRAEYWIGQQPGTATTTVNPGELPQGPTFYRRFDGAFFYLLQDLGRPNHQFVIKYDWYDPNIRISGSEIGQPGTRFTSADIRFGTLGLGYLYRFNENLKSTLYYEIVNNELTQLPEYKNDVPDNLLTIRMQFRF